MTALDSRVTHTEALRRGDVVRLKSLDQIAVTLDEDGTVDSLPFMEEMLALAGRELVVEARADKTCDTIENTGMTRRMTDTVHVQGARCDGSKHGGCQAYCLLFFKEDWLERVPEGADTAGTDLPERPEDTSSALVEKIRNFADKGPDTYRCQATELLRASTKMTGYGHYIEDIRTRNVPLTKFAHAMPFTLLNKYQRASERLPKFLRINGGRRFPRVRRQVRDGEFPPSAPLGLEPGDVVEVRSREEIEATLDENQRNRGLWFDEEMLVHCGRRGRVLARVERLIDERTGRMLKIRKDCIIVEGMVGCAGVYHNLCPRAVIAFWREAWLRKVV